MILDDVISAGTSVRESIAMIRAAGAEPCGVGIALDRQEKAGEDGVDSQLSAVQQVQRELGLPVVAVATLADLLALSGPAVRSATSGISARCFGLSATLRRLTIGGST